MEIQNSEVAINLWVFNQTLYMKKALILKVQRREIVTQHHLTR